MMSINFKRGIKMREILTGAFIGVLLGAVLAVVLHLVSDFDRDSTKFKQGMSRISKPVMINGDK
jgi:hypothetical protein